MKETGDFWQFICDYMPGYYTDDRILQDDILTRYIEGEEVCDSDIKWIEETFPSNKDIINELARLEAQFLNEAIHAYYKEYAKEHRIR